ncbi:MAG: M3 family oligoendopeptidase [Anaerolineae bacterium]|nr:M3 family oligoendopeptidase [Anaerolineae bacterium]
MKQYQFEQTHWSLTDLFSSPTSSEFDQITAALDAAVFALEQLREKLTSDIDSLVFLGALNLIERIYTLSARLDAYGGLWFESDTQSQEALSYRSRMDQRLTDVQNRTLFFSLWWKSLDAGSAERLMAVSGDDRYYLESLRRFKPHTLSEPEEKVINLKDVNGVNALTTIYSMLTNKFTFQIVIDGERKELTRAELMVYVRSPRPELRAAAYRELYRVYGEQGAVLAQIYNHIVRDWTSENIDLRQFSSPIAVRNLANDIPDAVADTLLQVSRQNVGVFQRYFRWKARRLGIDRLRRYDIYAPVSTSDKTYPFTKAADLILDTFEQFSPTLAEQARQVFANQHLDAEIRKGKAGGAFCAGVLPGLTPWVHMNYTGKANDVGTLAHELGHAVHALMAAEHSSLTFHSALPLAETASVFAEQLLTDRLLAEEPDVAVRRDLLVNAIDDAYATVLRQAYFVLFERQAHQMIVDQGATADELCAVYLDNLGEQFGDAVEIGDEFKWEWVSIPHIYDVPFYCYAYSFGQLLVLALYRQYKAQGDGFIPKYLRILTHGGAKSPAFILTEAGVDVTSSVFWQGGFDVINGLIDELEALE